MAGKRQKHPDQLLFTRGGRSRRASALVSARRWGAWACGIVVGAGDGAFDFWHRRVSLWLEPGVDLVAGERYLPPCFGVYDRRSLDFPDRRSRESRYFLPQSFQPSQSLGESAWNAGISGTFQHLSHHYRLGLRGRFLGHEGGLTRGRWSATGLPPQKLDPGDAGFVIDPIFQHGEDLHNHSGILSSA